MDASFEKKTRALYEHSKAVLRECSLSNGAIVAANTDLPRYPADAKAYRYVWPRDAAYVCVAADAAGISDIQEPFFLWCAERALRGDDIFFENYHTNGEPSIISGYHQLEQTGAVLWAIRCHYDGKKPSKNLINTLVEELARGLCHFWEHDHFTIPCTDLWEERVCYPDLKQVPSYTLASCIRGLTCAEEMVGDARFLEVAGEMHQKLYSCNGERFQRTVGDLADPTLCASLLGLAWPFEVVDCADKRMKKTIEAIRNVLGKRGGVMRYEGDIYDGWKYGIRDRKLGAGVWPILTFWLSVVLDKTGDRDGALEMFNWVVDRVEDDIPEQLFENNLQQSPKPLAWSHAMYLLAYEELVIDQG